MDADDVIAIGWRYSIGRQPVTIERPPEFRCTVHDDCREHPELGAACLRDLGAQFIKELQSMLESSR